MTKEIVIRVDWKVAAFLALFVLAVTLIPHLPRLPMEEKNTLHTYILSDPKCELCASELNAALQYLKRSGVDLGAVEEVNVYSPMGKKIMTEINASFAPLVVLEGNVDEVKGFLGQNLIKVGSYYVLRPIWPLRRIDFNAPDVPVTIQAIPEFARVFAITLMQQVPNVVVHTEPPDQNNIMVIEVPKKYEALIRPFVKAGNILHVGENTIFAVPKAEMVAVDAFLSSFSPYSSRVEAELASLKRLLGDRVNIIPHFIFVGAESGYKGPGYCVDANSTICSPEGVAEALENVRELCIYKLYGSSTWLRFANTVNKACTIHNIVPCWLSVAREMNLDTNTINECVGTVGLQLALQDKLLAQSLRINVSPTVFVGAWYPIVGYADLNTYLRATCAMLLNPPSACTMSS